MDFGDSLPLRDIFNDTGNDEEFLGFSDSEIQDLDGVKPSPKGEDVNIENFCQDSNSRSSGFCSTNDASLESDSDDDLSDSDEESARMNREAVMRERRSVLKNLMSDLNNDPVFKMMKTVTPSEYKRSSRPASRTRNRTRTNRYMVRSLPPVTRRRSKMGVDGDYPDALEDVPPSTLAGRLVVCFGPRKHKSSDEQPKLESSPRKRSYTHTNTQEHIIIPVDEVTEEMLENIAQHSVGKTYDTAHGTSCHQCRQKTLDTKSCCRSKECIGVRGQFCGPCLQNRYGESVRDALLDPEWSCPVCRGFCNCSICRNRNGKCATGILIGVARDRGFTNVKDFLYSLKGEDEDV